MPMYSGFWDNNYSLLTNRPSLARKVSQLYRRIGLKTQQRKIIALNGTAAGGAITNASYVRIAVPTDNDSIGGLRTVETVTLASGVTSAADETAIDTLVTQDSAPAAYAADVSGNGGGGKIGF